MEIIQQITPEEQKVYRFRNFDLRFVLVYYSLQRKPKGKRKWVSIEYWDNWDSRTSNVPEPELPLDVIQAAELEANKMIKIMGWKQWKG